MGGDSMKQQTARELSALLQKVQHDCPGNMLRRSDGNPVICFSLVEYLKKNNISYKNEEATLPGGATVIKSDILLPSLKACPRYLSRELHRMEEMACFELKPGESIQNHRHTENMEWWVVRWVDKEGRYHIEVSFCPPGSEHRWPVNDKGVPISFTALKWHAST